MGYCRPCRNQYRRDYYQRNHKREKQRVREEAWKRQGIDITWTEYTTLLDEQSGLCAICSDPPPDGHSLHVDHNHDTSTVRALLCANCNTALGGAQDNPALLHRMIDYLEQHQPTAR